MRLCAPPILFPAPPFDPSQPAVGPSFQLTPSTTPGGSWTETVLYGFQGTSDGGFPTGLMYHDGVIDGTVTAGGDPKYCGGIGCGGVFRLTPAATLGDPWTEKVVYSFLGGSDGLYPWAGITVDQDGTIYGTTRDGGDTSACAQNPGCGVVFQLKPPHDSQCVWQEKVLQRFDALDGWSPFAPLVIDRDGDLVGTTFYGGASAECQGGCGVVFATSTKH